MLLNVPLLVQTQSKMGCGWARLEGLIKDPLETEARKEIKLKALFLRSLSTLFPGTVTGQKMFPGPANCLQHAEWRSSDTESNADLGHPTTTLCGFSVQVSKRFHPHTSGVQLRCAGWRRTESIARVKKLLVSKASGITG